MYCEKPFSLALTLFLLIFASGCAFFAGRDQNRGAEIEKWQTENKSVKIRVTSYEESGANVNGAYYRFESAAAGSNDWREIVTFRHDDRPRIPADQVRFVNDHIGYLFMGWVYAVTTDGGANWSVWNASRDLPNWQCCNYQLIRDVQLTIDGAGTMTLNPIPQRQGEVPQLHTQDYGRYWIVE
jgi:hypothetical protein